MIKITTDDFIKGTLVLIKNADEYLAACKDFKVPAQKIDLSLLEQQGFAQTNGLSAIVYTDNLDSLGVLVHELTHVAIRWLENIGCDSVAIVDGEMLARIIETLFSKIEEKLKQK